MNFILAASVLRSRFAPMPAWLHIGFCVFAAVVFGAIFIRKKTLSSLIWLLICDTTVVLQFYNDKISATAVAICEIFLFLILFWALANERIKEKKRLLREEEEKKHPEAFFPEDLNDIDKLIQSENQNIPDNSDDVIKNAFEDDGK